MSSNDEYKERAVRKLPVGRLQVNSAEREISRVEKVAPPPDLKALYLSELEELKQELRKSYLDKLKEEATLAIEVQYEKKRKKLEEEFQQKEKQLERELTAMQAAIISIEKKYQNIEPELESAIIGLSLECLYQVAGKKENYRILLEDLVRNAITKIGVDGCPVVRLSRSDFELVGASVQAMDGCECLHDDSLAVSEVRIDSRYTRYDAGLISQLEVIQKALLENLAKHV